MVEKNSGRICSIDMLRTAAIALVVIFHFLYAYLYRDGNPFFLRKLGFIGISLFFIISGFVLAKKYSNTEKFSFRWFLRRYVRIAVLYYLALVVIVLLLQKQVYSGSLWKNLLYHSAFLGFISPETIYGIISAAWFLTPLIAFYILFPYLNKYTKKYSWFLALVFGAMLIFRIYKGQEAFFSPLLFIGEFCFGIALAYSDSVLPLVLSFSTVFFMPFTFIPFLVFYMVYSLEFKFLSGVWKSIGKNTLAIFLFHDAFINILLGEWHIFQLNKYHALFLFLVVVVFMVYVSGKIQKFILSSGFFKIRKKKSLNSIKTEKTVQMNKKIEVLFVIVVLIILGFYAFFIFSSTSEEAGGGLGTMKGMVKDSKILVVSDVSTEKQQAVDECTTIIKGKVSNQGTFNEANVLLTCRQSVFPILSIEGENEISKDLGTIDKGEEVSFEIIVGDCEVQKFECFV